MYKVLGTDQKEYGPVSLDQIQQWIKENRADAHTRVLADGSTEWKTLSELPEFAEALGIPSRPNSAPSTPPVMDPPPFALPPPPPPRTAADSYTMADRVLARGRVIDPVSCMRRSWDLLMRHFWLLVGATLVVNLVNNAVPIISGALFGGLYLLFLKLIRGQRGDFPDAFSGFSDHFLHLFLAGLVGTALESIGFLLCILPGIYLAVAWMFTLPLVIDKRLDFWPAMEISRRVIHQNWLCFFGLGLLCVLAYIVGVLCCIIGVVVAAPLAIGAVAYAYEDLFSSEPAAASRSF